MIILEKGKDFTFSLIDYINKVLEKRQELFKQAGVENFKKYREKYGKLTMPRIVIIVDEFHYMAQSASDDRQYMIALENILRIGRKYGLTCVFCDQTAKFKGLTDDALKQINVRIAMVNKLDEIETTLGVRKENYSEATLREIEACVDPGHLWMAEYNNNKIVIRHYVDVYLSDNEKLQIIDNAIKKVPSIMIDNMKIKIDSSYRPYFPVQKIYDLQQLTSKEKTTINIGVPSSLQDSFSIEFEKRYNNNIAVIGRDLSMQQDIFLSFLLNLSITGNSDIYVFSDERDPLYGCLVKSQKIKSKKCRIVSSSDLHIICESIDQLSEKIRRRDIFEKNTFIFWFGIPDLISEFEHSKSKSDIIDLKHEQSEEIVLGEDQIQKLEKDDALIEMARSEGKTVRKMIEEMYYEEDIESCQGNKEFIYNASEDLLSILKNGSRYGVFNYMAFDSPNNFIDRRDLSKDLFLHKILLNMSTEEFQKMGINQFDVKDYEIDSTSALYVNNKKLKFRPYIVKTD